MGRGDEGAQSMMGGFPVMGGGAMSVVISGKRGQDDSAK